ncbi:MarR family winged helix-turn-helix transcriptional regulator [uncultured Legionella sp.]|uniref:MarR family winged helix-turn-helix transcriptional regulator n=1 Tax=uncultured Legionella sp. TaxID=210934 RepID=UPI00261B9788|nr:MarR family transcriptional regulator [uncultured Legionella sp.]
MNNVQLDYSVDLNPESKAKSKKIIFALRKIMQHMDNHSRRLNKHYGLTVPQILSLYEIYEKKMLTLSELSKNIYLSTSTLVGVIDRLEEKGLVQRVRDVKDRRNIFISISEKGKKFVCSSPYLLHNQLDDNLKMLDEDVQIALGRSLDVLVTILEHL